MPRADLRQFLGFEGGFVATASRTLLAEYGRSLAQLVVVVPGRRAGRRLLEALALQAGQAIDPPRIVTEAELARELSLNDWNPASPAAVEWAWFDVLARAKPKELELFTTEPESALTFGARLALARQLVVLDRECAALEVGPESRDTLVGSVSSTRLKALGLLAERVRANLEAAGRIDPSRTLERVRNPTARRPMVQVLLAGVVEISPALRALLESLTPKPRVLIQADESCAAGFDEFGALVSEYWAEREIPLRDEDWLVVDDSRAAMRAALGWVARLSEGTTTDEQAIGVLGEELLPGLAQAFAHGGQSVHAAAGSPTSVSAPWLALNALHDWMVRRDFSALAAALRHPEIEACARVGDAGLKDAQILGMLDAWHVQHMPDTLHRELPGEDPLSNDVRSVRGRIVALCSELALDAERPLSSWSAAIAALLCRLYPSSGSEADPHAQRTRAALECFSALADELRSFGDSFCCTPLRGEQALRLWLDWTAEQAQPSARTPAAIEALGWLELTMEDAPYLLLLGLNDGWVQTNPRANSLLGEEHAAALNARTLTRLARDVHALTSIARQRRGDPRTKGVLAISLRHGVGGDPLRPSRLLFHVAEATVIARANRFFAKQRVAIEVEPAADISERKLVAPLPMSGVPALRSVSVSKFKTFLNSPYLHYLQNVLQLRRVRDDAWELDALSFGSLVHDDVLKPFGVGDAKDSTDEKRIEEFLHLQLRSSARARFGEHPLPAVRLQLQQLERRLSAFARCQAREAQAGWRIVEVECELVNASIDVDGVAIQIRGRVDRIDRHVDGRRWRILDYKTGDDSSNPRTAHLTRNGWRDLQLPLYHHFLRERLAGEIELGYFAIVRKLEDCGVNKVNFTPEELELALAAARAVLSQMLAGDFAHVGRAAPADRVQRALCGLSLLSLDDEEADDDDEAALEEPA